LREAAVRACLGPLRKDRPKFAFLIRCVLNSGSENLEILKPKIPTRLNQKITQARALPGMPERMVN
jgi:hypothetical protein